MAASATQRIASNLPQLLAVRAFVSAIGGSMEEVQEVTLDHLEKFVVLKLYKLLFRHAAADVREDERIGRCLRDASASTSLPTFSKEHSERFAQAVEELRKVDQYKAPREKAFVMLRACRIIEALVAEDAFPARRQAYDGEDRGDRCEEVSALCGALEIVVVEAAPQNLFSNIEFTRAFRHPSRIIAEERELLNQLSQALAAVAGVRPMHASGSLAQESLASAAAWASAPQASPTWLADAGITFLFEGRSAEDLLVGEVDELLEEYHRMARALRELAGVSVAGSTQ